MKHRFLGYCNITVNKTGGVTWELRVHAAMSNLQELVSQLYKLLAA